MDVEKRSQKVKKPSRIDRKAELCKKYCFPGKLRLNRKRFEGDSTKVDLKDPSNKIYQKLRPKLQLNTMNEKSSENGEKEKYSG